MSDKSSVAWQGDLGFVYPASFGRPHPARERNLAREAEPEHPQLIVD
jgi:hypothetical protein